MASQVNVHVGDTFSMTIAGKEEFYILARVSATRYAFINLSTGNRLSDAFSIIGTVEALEHSPRGMALPWSEIEEKTSVKWFNPQRIDLLKQLLAHQGPVGVR